MTTNTAYGYAAPPANVMSAAAFPVPYVTPVPIRNQKCCSNGLLKPGQRPCTPNRMATLCGFLFAAALVLAIGLAGDSPLSTLKPIETTSSYYYYRPRLLVRSRQPPRGFSASHAKISDLLNLSTPSFFAVH